MCVLLGIFCEFPVDPYYEPLAWFMINSQNVKSVHLLAVIIASVFKEESSVSAWMSFKEVANTGLPKLPLDDLKFLQTPAS